VVRSATATGFEMYPNRNKSVVGGRETPSFVPTTAIANGYSLGPEVSLLAGKPDCSFRVVDPSGSQRSITVCFDNSLVAEIDRRRQTHLWVASRFWVLCAERHLTSYLSEFGDYPPNGQLKIAEMDDDEMLLATYWKD
jgi:hypothetical protein